MDGFITRTVAVMDRYDPEKEVYSSVDEWGVWLAPTPGTNPGLLIQQNTARDAVIAALYLNIFARHANRVKVANIAQMVNVLQAMILTDEERMVLTPTCHVFRLYLPFRDATIVPVELASGVYRTAGLNLPRIAAIAARDTEGRLWLAVTIDDPERSPTIPARFAGVTAIGAQGQVLTGARVNSHNTCADPAALAPRARTGSARDGAVTRELPAKSVTGVAISE